MSTRKSKRLTKLYQDNCCSDLKVGWLAIGWLAGSLAGCLADGELANWLAGWLAGWPAGWWVAGGMLDAKPPSDRQPAVRITTSAATDAKPEPMAGYAPHSKKLYKNTSYFRIMAPKCNIVVYFRIMTQSVPFLPFAQHWKHEKAQSVRLSPTSE